MLKRDISPERRYGMQYSLPSRHAGESSTPKGPTRHYQRGCSDSTKARRDGKGAKITYMFKTASHAVKRSCTSNKLMLVLIVMVSIVLHLICIEGIYLMNRTKLAKKEPPTRSQEIAFEIKLPPKPKKTSKPKRAQAAKKIRARKAQRAKKPRKARIKKIKRMTQVELASVGRQYMGMLRKGAFPSLILRYRSPSRYIQEMYALGCKTVVLVSSLGQYYEVDLFEGQILPFSVADFRGFSRFKRVIQDSEWDPVKEKIAYELGVTEDSIEILLLVPVAVEECWIGHQVNVFREMNLQVSDVESVEAVFENSRLKLRALHLKDGSERIVNDQFGT